jgi:hypothetical protein
MFRRFCGGGLSHGMVLGSGWIGWIGSVAGGGGSITDEMWEVYGDDDD